MVTHMQDGDLISRKALLEEYEWLMTQTSDYNKPALQEHIDRINRQPAIDAEPVKRGKWIGGQSWAVTCSECKYLNIARDGKNYCPYCGAKMEGSTE